MGGRLAAVRGSGRDPYHDLLDCLHCTLESVKASHQTPVKLRPKMTMCFFTVWNDAPFERMTLLPPSGRIKETFCDVNSTQRWKTLPVLSQNEEMNIYIYI